MALIVFATIVGATTACQAADGTGGERASDVVAVKAAFLYNFAKFAEWPALTPHTPIVFCVVGDDHMADVLADTVRGQTIGAHPLTVSRPDSVAGWRACQVLFLGESETNRAEKALTIKQLPVLTVSDGEGFALSGGMIALYVDSGRIRFAINVDAAEHAGLRLSSRLLGLAKVVRNDDAK